MDPGTAVPSWPLLSRTRAGETPAVPELNLSRKLLLLFGDKRSFGGVFVIPARASAIREFRRLAGSCAYRDGQEL